jgi:hypothetical protein
MDAQDLPRTGELVAASINALCERHGFGPMAAVRPPAFSMFSLEDDPEGLWVAIVAVPLGYEAHERTAFQMR